MNIYSEEDIEKQEEEENKIAKEWIALMLVALKNAEEKIQDQMAIFFQKYSKDGVITYQEARKYIGNGEGRRITSLIKKINETFNSSFTELKEYFSDMANSLIQENLKAYEEELEELENIDLKWGEDNQDWEDRLQKDVEKWEQYIALDVKKTFSEENTFSESYEQINKRFVTMSNVLTALVLTESTAITSIVQNKILKEKGLKRYRFYANRDERTCETCNGLHNKEFLVSACEPGVNAPPMHTRCRCMKIPIE